MEVGKVKMAALAELKTIFKNFYLDQLHHHYHLSAQAWRRPHGKVHPGQPQSLLEPTPRTFYHHFSLCKLTIAILRANISETVTCGLLGDQELLGRLCQPPPAGQFLRFFESFLKPALLLSMIPCRASGAANIPEKVAF